MGRPETPGQDFRSVTGPVAGAPPEDDPHVTFLGTPDGHGVTIPVPPEEAPLLNCSRVGDCLIDSEA
jgi:hypothetical protein